MQRVLVLFFFAIPSLASGYSLGTSPIIGLPAEMVSTGYPATTLGESYAVPPAAINVMPQLDLASAVARMQAPAPAAPPARVPLVFQFPQTTQAAPSAPVAIQAHLPLGFPMPQAFTPVPPQNERSCTNSCNSCHHCPCACAHSSSGSNSFAQSNAGLRSMPPIEHIFHMVKIPQPPRPIPQQPAPCMPSCIPPCMPQPPPCIPQLPPPCIPQLPPPCIPQLPPPCIPQLPPPCIPQLPMQYMQAPSPRFMSRWDYGEEYDCYPIESPRMPRRWGRGGGPHGFPRERRPSPHSYGPLDYEEPDIYGNEHAYSEYGHKSPALTRSRAAMPTVAAAPVITASAQKLPSAQSQTSVQSQTSAQSQISPSASSSVISSTPKHPIEDVPKGKHDNKSIDKKATS